MALCFNGMAQERAMWIWETNEVLSSVDERNILINECNTQGITEIFLYAHNVSDSSNWGNLKTFIANMNCQSIKVWAMDGYRGYFSDWYGPQGYYDFIDNVVSYNEHSSPLEQFYGVHGDNEPQDGQGEPLASFHNGLADSDLSTSGGGLWGDNEKEDREMLMIDWLDITETAYQMCHANDLKYGQATPSWVDDYYGEPVSCTYKGIQDDVMHHLVKYLDVYIIMSYNTNPNNVLNRINGELTYISSLPEVSRPLLFAAGETHCNVGANISYCDTPDKDSKDVFLSDLEIIEHTATGFSAYTGFAIHDWKGWKDLETISADNSDPGCITTNTEKTEPYVPIKAFPNPSNTGQFHINNNSTWAIYTTYGTFVKKGNSNLIDLSNSGPGVYLLKVNNESQVLIVE
jgi:hypothetical protein